MGAQVSNLVGTAFPVNIPFRAARNQYLCRVADSRDGRHWAVGENGLGLSHRA